MREQIRSGRRRLVGWLLGLGGGSLFLSLLSVLGLLRPAERAAEKEKKAVEAGDRLVFAMGRNKGQVIKRADLFEQHTAVLAFPEAKEDNQDNLIILIKLNPAQLQPPTKLEWTQEGFVAYSAICTHLGCTVFFSHEAMESAPFPHIHCPCHAGLYDATRGAIVVGGPPPRPLPQLPIQINEKDEIVAAGTFTEPIGPI